MRRRLFVRPAIVTGFILLIPLVMTILDRNKPLGDGWRWGPGDFVVMGALLFGAGVTYEFLASKTASQPRKIGLGLAILFLVFLIWVELAVDAVSRAIGWLLR